MKIVYDSKTLELQAGEAAVIPAIMENIQFHPFTDCTLLEVYISESDPN
jgi:hypothetical protein